MELIHIKTAECYESAFNPRGKKFDGPAFDELVASVKEKGVLQPVLARRKKSGGKVFEVIAGARRLRASITSGKEMIPANVVEMTDAEALEAQIIENLQRQDIHPIEEGLAYKRLIAENKAYSIEIVAAKMGKSKPYIRQRLSLADLIPKAQDALREGDMTIGHAVILARVDAKLQAKVIGDHYLLNQETHSLRTFIQKHMTAELAKSPPWGKGSADEKAIADAAGPCPECPKSADLFGKNASLVCENPTCYAKRIAAWLVLKQKEYADKKVPLTLISSSYSGSKGVLGSESYKKVPATERKGSDHVGMALVVEGYEDVGKVIAICTKKNCSDKKHNPYYHAPEKMSPAQVAQRKKEEEKELKEEALKEKTLVSTAQGVKWPLTGEKLDAFLRLATQDCYDHKDITNRLGLVVNEDDTSEDILAKHVATLDDTGKVQIMVELMLRSQYGDELEASIKALGK